MAELIRPDQLLKATQATEIARAREISEAENRRLEEKAQLRAAFIERQVPPDVADRLARALTAAAERGESHLQILTFPSDLCTDGGRMINNRDPNWPETLVGFAQRAFDYYKAELQPLGYKLRAEILDFPGGMPGEVAITLSW